MIQVGVATAVVGATLVFLAVRPLPRRRRRPEPPSTPLHELLQPAASGASLDDFPTVPIPAVRLVEDLVADLPVDVWPASRVEQEFAEIAAATERGAL